ncbi:nicotinamide riboside kinase 1 [Periplaneta americana]|uniref:nicotinamide riboside kinase 1 n=1 Tax=Periplaneta americana TaxID=6978 RepID=UPI0037E86912
MWLIIGVSGATCSGKSTLAKSLHNALPGSLLICQDDFFLPLDSELHTFIPNLKHFNWEIMSSLDMEKMHSTVENILSTNNAKSVLLNDLKDAVGKVLGSSLTNDETEQGKLDPISQLKSSRPSDQTALSIRILIIEGFLIFNDKKLSEMCRLKYFMTLSREQCWARRSVRTYDPPDVPGYFDQCVWPEYEKHRDQVFTQVPNVTVIDGTLDRNNVLKKVLLDVLQAAQELR